MSKSASSRLQARRHTNNSPRNSRVPSWRFHKASGQTYVVLSGKTIYCGKPEDPSAEQRYQWLVDNEPELTRRLPQFHLASYIGVDAVSLSRLKRKLKPRP